ncbi:MAG: cyclic pyranopterin monophosphate synthase MoaC [Desulfurococcales archaeon]|nr:cyclic pyranopterin monophosphate synthase MoaC [Desulfurococcales archaeon]
MSKKEGMIDISGKPPVAREAKACGRIFLREETIKAIMKSGIGKGDVREITKAVALLAVKRTPELLPFCHPIPIEWIGFDMNVGDNYVEVCVTVKTTAKTGVEMEAIVGTLTALANIWDMVKSLEKDERGQYPVTRITDVRVEFKHKSSTNY